MKKPAAIFLLGLFMFNLFGYRILFYFAQQQSDIQLEASLDKDKYDEADLVTIKIPLLLPYQTDWKEFERIDGEISLNGKIYKYVKRKVFNSELILLCLPDRNKMRLQTAKDDFFKNANDLVQNGAQKKSDHSKLSFIKNGLSEYDKSNAEYLPSIDKLQNVHGISAQVPVLNAAPHSSPEQPPELV